MKFWIVSCVFHGSRINRLHFLKHFTTAFKRIVEIVGLNAHNFILCMNSKDLSEEVKDTLKYTVLCNYSIKNLCGAVLQNGEFLFGNQIPALKTNALKHEDLSNALYKEGLIKVPHAKLAALTPNFLQIIIFVNTW